MVRGKLRLAAAIVLGVPALGLRVQRLGLPPGGLVDLDGLAVLYARKPNETETKPKPKSETRQATHNATEKERAGKQGEGEGERDGKDNTPKRGIEKEIGVERRGDQRRGGWRV